MNSLARAEEVLGCLGCGRSSAWLSLIALVLALKKKKDALAGPWKPIIQECRNYVPIIKGSNHLGSGLLVSSNGFIVTNAHVVDGKGALLISLHDGTRAKAQMVHRHQQADLAIVKAAIHTPRYFELSNHIAHDCEAGDEALAIGHPRGLHFTATRGIVSETRRAMSDGLFVQTDVDINPGNSGGPLLDADGNLIGINTYVLSDSDGLGFAIPGMQVFEYWQEFFELYRANKIAIPSDEELTQSEQSLPPELLHAAAELAELAIEKNPELDNIWTITTLAGDYFFAVISNNWFISRHYIAELDHTHQQDAQLFFQLLRWQNDMYIVQFEIDDDKNLKLDFTRSFEDLDVSEACFALIEMAKAVDLYAVRVKDYLHRGKALV